jgi:hypothetical protein
MYAPVVLDAVVEALTKAYWYKGDLRSFLVRAGEPSSRLDTGRVEPIVFTPLSNAGPAELDDGEFEEAVAKLAQDVRLPTRPQEAAQRLFEVEARSGLRSPTPWRGPGWGCRSSTTSWYTNNQGTSASSPKRESPRSSSSRSPSKDRSAAA